MTGLIGKVKEALHSNSKTEQPEGTHGHHSSRAANAADPRIDSDRDHRAAPGSTVGSTGNYTTSDNYTHSGTHGPHESNLANKADPRVDSDRDHRAAPGTTSGLNTHTGTTSGLNTHTGAHTGLNTHSGTSGPHSSNLANKADPRVDSDLDHSRNMGMNTTTGTHGTTSGLNTHTGAHTGLNTHSGTTGPHSSNLMNKADPRVDSDRDHRAAPGTTSGLNTHTGTTSGLNTHSGTTGPHESNLMNKADPRVDSDRDHRGTTGVMGGSAGVGGFSSGTSAHTTHNAHSTHGPHDSNLMNKADPRVDSDRDHRAAPGTTSGLNTHTSTTHGTAGLGSSTHNSGLNTHAGVHDNHTSGPHSSNLANKADPRVDSDRDHRAAPGTHNTTGLGSSTTHGTTGMTGNSLPGPAPGTAGPHSSDAMNKLDPRVDSDLDGSKTYGGDKTYTRSMMHKDPTDAAQVPPSVLQKHIGPPIVEHDDHHHDRTKRHSVSHQEEHRGL